MADIEIIILAAGKGTRMRSALPKVLHGLAGKPMLGHVIDTADTLDPSRIHVVYGHGGDTVPAAFPDRGVTWVEQDRQLGTGHAVDVAMPGVEDDSKVLVLYGDVPLIETETLQALADRLDEADLALLTVELDDPSGYGRIVRDDEGRVTRIVEEKDAAPSERAITEVNTGILAANGARLRDWLDRLENDNAQGEYYLTDIIGMARQDGRTIEALTAEDPLEVQGVNNRVQLAELERACQASRAEQMMRDGATLADPARVDVRGRVDHATDVWIDVNVIFEGDVEIGEGAVIGPNCLIRDSRIGPGAVIEAHTVLEGAEVGADCRVGPFARLRPGTVMAEAAKIGNFVETKQARLGSGTKVNHLSYVGDAEVGADVNIGAGTITCNYDGANKHQTVIEDGVFVGSDSQLVAPVRIGRDATVGAGSTITRDVEGGRLALSRTRQRHIEGWQRPRKK